MSEQVEDDGLPLPGVCDEERPLQVSRRMVHGAAQSAAECGDCECGSAKPAMAAAVDRGSGAMGAAAKVAVRRWLEHRREIFDSWQAAGDG